MKTVTYRQTSLATALFFAAPGIIYGLFSSRLPILKQQTGATETDVGLILFSFGLAAAVSLALTPVIVKWIRVKSILPMGLFLMCAALGLAAFAQSVFSLICLLVLVGLGMGALDVTMNMQGIAIEQEFAKPTLGILHASYSLGGVTGSLLGSLFAQFQFSLEANFLLPSLTLLFMSLMARKFLIDSAPTQENDSTKPQNRTFPLLLLGCGVFAFITYAAEGICGDWGSLMLVHEKGAPESSAALAYATTAGSCFLSRFIADKLRERFGDFRFALVSALIFIVGATTIVLSTNWAGSLIGFSVAGFGLGPLVPIVFSFAGRIPGQDPKVAVATVSFMGYVGLLACPPFFGFLAHHWNYNAIFITECGIACLCLAFVFLLRSKTK